MNRRSFLRQALYGVAMAGLAVTAEGYFWERTQLEVSRHSIPMGLRKPLRAAFMSDFHRSDTTSAEDIREAALLCMQQKPDVILLGGDFISDDVRLADDCAQALQNLSAPQGVYFVLGNHDIWHGKTAVRTALQRAGFSDITNRNTTIGDGVRLCGLDDIWTGNPDYRAAFRGTGDDARLVLSHNPRIFPHVHDQRCTVICGHTHGGQVRVPLVPNPYLRSWKNYVKGWFIERNSRMYVNRGVGTLTLPIRFRCRPEITLLDCV